MAAAIEDCVQEATLIMREQRLFHIHHREGQSLMVQGLARQLQHERRELEARIGPNFVQRWMNSFWSWFEPEPLTEYQNLADGDPLLRAIRDLTDVNDAFLCSISQEILLDPVIVSGHLYEREIITLWLTQPRTGPVHDPCDPNIFISERDVMPAPRRYCQLLEQYIRLRLEQNQGQEQHQEQQ